MPIYLRFPDSIKGKVNAEGHSAAGGASGGVWKTTNFLTTDPGTVSLARISLANGFMGKRTVSNIVNQRSNAHSCPVVGRDRIL